MQLSLDGEHKEILMPAECQQFMAPSQDKAFHPKHAKQQASILGHMKEAGLLQVRIQLRACTLLTWRQRQYLLCNHDHISGVQCLHLVAITTPTDKVTG